MKILKIVKLTVSFKNCGLKYQIIEQTLIKLAMLIDSYLTFPFFVLILVENIILLKISDAPPLRLFCQDFREYYLRWSY